jgi:DNA-binding beta-propeller fold protein YncE
MKLRLALLLLALPVCALRSAQITTGQAADLVLGQADFISKVSAAASATTCTSPSGIAVDPATGKVFVSDTTNNRVLRYASLASLTNGAPAEAVLGQPDFTSHGAATTQKELNSPFGLACDKNGTLWVADSGNNRVLRFDNASAKPQFSVNADGVLGQAAFNTNTTSTPPTQSSLKSPRGVAVDANGALWIADYGENRVLRFDDAANVINGANADGVLGAPNFTTDFGGLCLQYAFHGPLSVAVDANGRLWVADYTNNRVLRFDEAANLSNGGLASGVLGQSDFTHSTSPVTATASTLNHPSGLGIDSSGALWVADTLEIRVLRYDSAAAKANGASANAALGQSDFVSKLPSTTSTGLGGSFGLTVDSANGLWVADLGNLRVLHYTPQTSAPTYSQPGSVAIALTGKARITTTKPVAILKGTASSSDGIARVEYRIGKKGGFKAARGGAAWKLKARLKPGKNTITIRAVSATGQISSFLVVHVTRQ